MSNNRNNTSAGACSIGLSGILTIVFIVLKLVGVIDWSWWWVLSPFWISWGIYILIVLIILIVALIKDK